MHCPDVESMRSPLIIRIMYVAHVHADVLRLQHRILQQIHLLEHIHDEQLHEY